eukprot:710478-Pelagomonas_calceolata.AAC.4
MCSSTSAGTYVEGGDRAGKKTDQGRAEDAAGGRRNIKQRNVVQHLYRHLCGSTRTSMKKAKDTAGRREGTGGRDGKKQRSRVGTLNAVSGSSLLGTAREGTL